MFLTITNTQKPATDLGYLLHKNPWKVHNFELAYGKAYVFYPKAQEQECTVALVLDINPVELAKKEKGNRSESFSLGQYVNDRPYVASSFLSQAIAKIFSSALNSHCKSHPELVTTKLPLSINIFSLPVKGKEDLLKRLFEPLGYKVGLSQENLSEKFPEWGKSYYYNLQLSNKVTVQELLSHLYILIPVLDKEKHYFVGKEEIEKLFSKGGNWLKNHPEAKLITRRYLKNLKSFTNDALERLIEIDGSSDPVTNKKMDVGDDLHDATTGKTLNQMRLEAVFEKLKNTKVKTVIDLGCGEGKLLEMLLPDKQFQKISGMDVMINSLQKAKERLHLDELPLKQKEKVALFQGSLLYRDKRLERFDAATLIEVIEHIEPERLETFEKVLFQHAKPKTIILTTPNKDYNAHFENLYDDEFRYEDHRFEWTRQEFKEWTEKISTQYGYTIEIFPVGPVDEKLGSPTQMAIFSISYGP